MCFAQLKLDLQERRLFDLLELRMAVRTAVSGYEVCYRDIFQRGLTGKENVLFIKESTSRNNKRHA